MAAFPSPLERIVASALLLLAIAPPKSRLDDEDRVSEREASKIVSSVSGDSNTSSLSLITASELSTEEIRARKIRIMALAALRRQMKLKVVQRSRKKTQASWKAISASSAATSFGSETAESSCLSSSSSVASSERSRSRHVARSAWINHKSDLSMVRQEPMKRKRLVLSGHMRRQAEAILRLLSGGRCFSEIKIRQTIGDSPDTSKALRMLLKLQKVKRSGAGGRQNPYIYTMA